MCNIYQSDKLIEDHGKLDGVPDTGPVLLGRLVTGSVPPGLVLISSQFPFFCAFHSFF